MCTCVCFVCSNGCIPSCKEQLASMESVSTTQESSWCVERWQQPIESQDEEYKTHCEQVWTHTYSSV